MANFQESLVYTLVNEGSKFSNEASDHGGATKFGITLATLNNWHKTQNLPQATTDDLRDLSHDDAARIYESLYWAPLLLVNVNQDIATALFDVCVNMGQGNCLKLAQKALGIVADGVIGQLTTSSLETIERKKFLASFIPLVQNRYIDIALNDSTQLRFLKGWLARSQRLLTLMI